MVSTLVSVSLFHCYVYFISPFYEDDCYPKEISFIEAQGQVLFHHMRVKFSRFRPITLIGEVKLPTHQFYQDLPHYINNHLRAK